MAEIRPPASGALPQSGRPAAPARSAAQRAFFQQALGAAPVAAQAQVPALVPRPAAQGAAPVAVKTTEADAPQRYLRPGSLLDIKV